ncbi:MAG: hypothetical protein J0H25_15415 [Rhizobiales bacterium]|nr:hypothetical protein [Hyphomicrobiales bacterium]
MKWKIALAFLIMFVGVSGVRCAPDVATAAISKVYSSYRIALSYLRSGETELGGISLATFIDEWSVLDERLTANPPAPFDKDPQFTVTLADVLKHAQDSRERLVQGDVTGAVTELEPIRSILAQMRHRNGVRTLSDCIDDIGAKMDRLQAMRDANFNSADQQQVEIAQEIVGSLSSVLRACQQQSPEKNQDQYNRLIDQAFSSVESAKEALATHDSDRFIRIVRELRSIDRILFQQFG